MKSAPFPLDEEDRLEALRRTGLLDSPAEEEFDDLTRLAALICGTPIALVSLVDADRQWFKAKHGLDAAQTPRDVAFCAHAILEPGETFVVADTHADGRFADNPLVTGDPNVRFYAGVPLASRGGHALGTLCVIDNEPRSLEPFQLAALEILRKHAEQLIQAREIRSAGERLMQGWDLLENVSDMVQSVDTQGRYLYVNKAWQETLGYTTEEARQLTMFDVIVPEDHLHCQAILAQLVQGVEQHVIETTFLAKSGSRIPVRGTANCRFENGEPVLTRGVFRDATAERRLAESEARHRAVLETALDAMLTTDGDGVVLTWNPAADRLFGTSGDDLAGARMQDLLADDVAAPPLGARRATEARCRDGSTFDAEFAVNAVEVNDRTVWSWVVQDISLRKAAERAKDEFVSTVSHELRTPLTSIRGALGLLEGGVLGELSEKSMEVVRIATSNSDRLIRLINDILDFEKMQAGRMELHISPCRPSQLAAEAIAGMQGFAEQHGVHLELCETGAPRVFVDPDRIAQVFANLLSNAIKYSPPDGTVSVSILSCKKQYVRFEVRDGGPGIGPEERKKLFQRFQQVDGSASRPKGGTGLGLAITKGIIERHKGRIGVETGVDQGSTFWFELPVISHQDGPDEFLRSGPLPILLVEDDEDLSSLLKLILEKEGYGVHTVGTLAAAATFLESSVPRAMLLDLQLPDGDGLEFLDRYRHRLQETGVPVLVITGRDPDMQDVSHPLLMDWLVKPFDEQLLLRSLRRAVRRHGSARILVVEDDDALRSLLVTQLEGLGVEVLEAADGGEALAIVRATRPDLLVLDVGIPRLDGFGVVDALRQQVGNATIPLIVYSGRDLSSADRDQLVLGVTRFLTKSRASPQEFEAVVRHILNGLLAGGSN